MKTFFTNHPLSPLYQEWLLHNNILENTKSETAQWIFLKTMGLFNALKNGYFPNARVILGFPYSYQLAAKNMFWFNIKRHFGIAEASEISPFTLNPEDKNAFYEIKKMLRDGEKIILKNNRQKRQGLYILRYEKELTQQLLHHYVVAQKIIENGHKIENKRYNIRLYLSVLSKNGLVEFSLHKHGKILYTENENDYITNTRFYTKNLPLLTQDTLFDQYAPVRWFDNCEKQIFRALEAHQFYFFKRLIPKVTYCDIFGVDILLTTNGTPLILEFNRMPNMRSSNEDDNTLKKEVLWGLLNQTLY